jgi:alkaline phosphatase D
MRKLRWSVTWAEAWLLFVVGGFLGGFVIAQEPTGPQLANGLRIGEVTSHSAIVWTRLTASATRVAGDASRLPREALDEQIPSLEGAVPGIEGKVSLVVATDAAFTTSREHATARVTAATDFTHQWQLPNLAPATKYFVRISAAGPNGKESARAEGSFTTAPPTDAWSDVRLAVMSCQGYSDQDDAGGFLIYPAMRKLGINFYVATGDNVYYDNDPPTAKTVAMARYHWNRMYALPHLVEFHRHVPGYWEKDDHDLVRNDIWPRPRDRAESVEPLAGPLTWSAGLRIFREQVPLGETPYRTIRWGKGLQIWLVEGRDFRSPNNQPDGPDKTIWGREQLAWLQESLLASDAEFRLLISPTPIVGPDRGGKADNHANQAFAHEGNAFRAWTKEHRLDNLFVCCGDRHWQYHSVDPTSGLHEFAAGAASDQHAGGSPGRDEVYHRFHRVKGGFLSVHVRREKDRPTIALRHHDVRGEVVYEYTASRP